MNKEISLSYKILADIYFNGAYLNMALKKLNDSKNRALVTKIVYGVLERNTELEYYIGKLTDKKPAAKCALILKIGIYILLYADGIPQYACISECVNLTEEIGKKQLKAFVNAVLNKFNSDGVKMPEREDERLSVLYSTPLWLVKAYIKQYGRQTAEQILSAESVEEEHCRYNSRRTDKNGIVKLFKDKGIKYRESEYGFYIRNSKAARELFAEGLITFQSPSSMLVCRALGLKDGANVLDICASPGGKSVYAEELANNVSVTACDLHPHRVELIKSYARRMGANIIALESDALEYKAEWENKYDYVLCDAPCSGLGVAKKKPDILLNKSMEDINALSEIQYNILHNAISYCKTGGVIVYSTCTTLREENYNVIGKTLKYDKRVVLEKMDIDKENEGFIQLLPTEGMDGFFIAKLRKIDA